MKIICDCKDSLSLDEITEFQGGLKARSPEEIEKIIKSFKKFGFAFPLFVWPEGETNWCLDGHGRLLALKKMQEAGEKNGRKARLMELDPHYCDVIRRDTQNGLYKIINRLQVGVYRIRKCKG